MQSTALFTRGSTAGCRSRPALGRGHPPMQAALLRRTVKARAEAQEKAQEVADKVADTAGEAADKAKEAENKVEERIPSAQSGSFQDRVDAAGREISKFTQDTSGLTQENTTIKKSQNGKPSFEEAMSFSGPVPERANSRLAMLAFAAAAGAELVTGSPVAAQLKKSPVLIGLTFLVFIVASIIPIVKGEDPNKKGIGPFTPRAELWNGRLAMMGFIALLLTETFKSTPAL